LVTLWSLTGSTWKSNTYTYRAATVSGKAAMTQPASGSLLPSSVLFQWSPASTNTTYDLYVGTTRGMNDVYAGGQTTGLSKQVALPAGRTIYVRLWTWLGSTWLYTDYTYRT
jgi:hypothetical protein